MLQHMFYSQVYFILCIILALIKNLSTVILKSSNIENTHMYAQAQKQCLWNIVLQNVCISNKYFVFNVCIMLCIHCQECLASLLSE